MTLTLGDLEIEPTAVMGWVNYPEQGLVEILTMAGHTITEEPTDGYELQRFVQQWREAMEIPGEPDEY